MGFINNNDEGDGGVGQVMGWVIFVGIIIGINVLSYLFDWPFWVY